MKAFQAWFDFELGSATLFSPYQTSSARPAPPAWIHGMTLTASPVAAEPSLTCIGGVHVFQPLAALDALTNTWRCCGFDWSFVSSSTIHAASRLRAWSIDTTGNRTSTPAGRLSTMWINFVSSP